MDWRDCVVHGFDALPETDAVVLDVDYCIHREAPTRADELVTYWVSPATLVFQQVTKVEIQIGGATGGLVLRALERGDEQTATGEWRAREWRLVGQEGQILLHAAGYSLAIRRPPLPTSTPRLTLAERGGVSVQPHA